MTRIGFSLSCATAWLPDLLCALSLAAGPSPVASCDSEDLRHRKLKRLSADFESRRSRCPSLPSCVRSGTLRSRLCVELFVLESGVGMCPYEATTSLRGSRPRPSE